MEELVVIKLFVVTGEPAPIRGLALPALIFIGSEG